MNDHFLKNRYKDYTIEELEVEKLFAGSSTEIRDIENEIKRREQETALIQEDAP